MRQQHRARGREEAFHNAVCGNRSEKSWRRAAAARGRLCALLLLLLLLAAVAAVILCWLKRSNNLLRLR